MGTWIAESMRSLPSRRYSCRTRVVAVVELQHILDERIQIYRDKFGGRQASIVAEFVHQALHGVDLIDNGFDGFG